jgi:YD repeat-containing protein
MYLEMKLVYKINKYLLIVIGLSLLSFIKDVTPGVEFDTVKDGLGIPNVIPSAPAVSAFERYGNYPVNFAFGTPEINIPIFTMNTGDVSLPISISYHAGGNKVSDLGGIVGLGWSLNAGGVISRVLNGRPDEIPYYGFMNVNKSWYMDDIVESDYNNLKNTSQGVFDTEPDLFNYSFPGHSGSFMYDQDGNIRLIPYEPLLIQPTISGTKITSIKITLPEGTEYVFSEPETTEVNGFFNNDIPEYNSAWHLKSIHGPDPQSSGIELSYADYTPEPLPAQKLSSMVYRSSSGYYILEQENTERPFFTNKIINEKRCTTIISANSNVSIRYEGKQIDDINITNPVTLKNIPVTFFFKAFSQSPITGILCDRMLLSKLQVGYKTWEFEYEESYTEPSLYSFNKDHWGYFNNANNSHALPKVYFNFQELGGNANRNIDPDAMKWGILKKITYPTGGYTLFTYGANQICILKGEGNEAKIDYHDAVKKVTYHIDNQTYTSTTHNWPSPYHDYPCEPVHWYSPLNVTVEIGTKKKANANEPMDYIKEPYLQIRGSWISDDVKFDNFLIKSGSIYDEYDNIFKYKVTLPYILNYGQEYDDEDIPYHDMTQLTSTDPSNYISTTYERDGYCYIPADETNSNMAVGGLRIETINDYDESGNLVSKRKYNYNLPSCNYKSSGKLVSGFLKDILDKKIYIQECGITTGPVGTPPSCEKTPSRIIIYDNPQGDFEMSGAIVVYDIVTETMVDKDGNTLGRTVYNYQNNMAEGQGVVTYPQLPVKPNRVWQCGLLKQMDVFDADNNLVRSVVNNYESSNYHPINAFVAVKNRGFDWAAYNCCLNNGVLQTPRIVEFAYKNYEVLSFWRMKTSETVTDYLQDTNGEIKEVVTITTYTYATNSEKWQLPKKVSVNTSNDKTRTTENLYQFEIHPDAQLPGLIRQQKTYIVNQGVVNAKLINYNFNKPSAIKEWYRTTPDNGFADLTVNGDTEVPDNDFETDPSTTILYEKGRPVQVTTRKGITSYVWSYANSYPIAMIEGKEYAAVVTILGGNTAVQDFRAKVSPTKDEIKTFLDPLYSNSGMNYVMVTTYTYEPLFGLTSQSDANAVTIKYEYDTYGRLKIIWDDVDRIQKTYDYNLINN